MSTHNIGFYEEISKIIIYYHQICTLFLLLYSPSFLAASVTQCLTFLSKYLGCVLPDWHKRQIFLRLGSFNNQSTCTHKSANLTPLYRLGSGGFGFLLERNALVSCWVRPVAPHRWDCVDLQLGPGALHHRTLIVVPFLEILAVHQDLFALK